MNEANWEAQMRKAPLPAPPPQVEQEILWQATERWYARRRRPGLRWAMAALGILLVSLACLVLSMGYGRALITAGQDSSQIRVSPISALVRHGQLIEELLQNDTGLPEAEGPPAGEATKSPAPRPLVESESGPDLPEASGDSPQSSAPQNTPLRSPASGGTTWRGTVCTLAYNSPLPARGEGQGGVKRPPPAAAVA